MPSSMTHSYFSKDVYDKLNPKLKKKLENNIEDLKTFANGPDPFFFYNMHLGKKSKLFQDYGMYMHGNNVNDYFINLINYINDNKLNNNKQVLAFLYGNVCHFALDSVAHPYIIYRTGIFDKNDKKTYKYNGLHQEMEYYIDIYMIFNNEKMEAKKYKVYNNIFNYQKLDDKLIKLINNVYFDTYEYKNLGKIYNKCLMDMKRFYKFANYDPYGIKKVCYKFLDKVSSKKNIRKEELSYHVYHNKKIHYLNLERKEWIHPSHPEEIYNYSFIELYIIADAKAVKIINSIDEMLNNKDIDNNKIKELFNNNSYVTGKDCNEKNTISNFEF